MNPKKESQNKVVFITHANVSINPMIPIQKWGLSKEGIDRHDKFNANKIIQHIKSIYSSNEKKAIDGATILASHLNLPFNRLEDLGENDRSSTGYLEEEEFQTTVDAFFSHPEISIRGWERAIDVQKRIVNAVEKILKENKTQGDIAIVAHGGVGALLLCHLLHENISRKFDQPFTGGGSYFCFNKKTLEVIHLWKDISA